MFENKVKESTLDNGCISLIVFRVLKRADELHQEAKKFGVRYVDCINFARIEEKKRFESVGVKVFA